MDKKNLQKIIKDFFKPFAKEHGFRFAKPTLMIRLSNDTLHIINFDIPNNNFNCTIAIQPLYIPSDTIVLSFGNRINHFKTRLTGVWGNSNQLQEVQNDLQEVKDLLELNAMPWFEEVGRPEGIVSFIEKGFSEDINIIVGFPPSLRSLYLGYSYSYINKFEKADESLLNFMNLHKDDSRDWVIKQNEMVISFRLLIKNNAEKVKGKLEGIIRQTCEDLKLKITE